MLLYDFVLYIECFVKSDTETVATFPIKKNEIIPDENSFK